MQCAFPGCPRQDAVACSYTDRHSRECGYAWCAEHRIDVNRRPYCRRHGGVMTAIASHPYDDIAPPDLDNRALSLCEWVAADIDKEVRDMLSQVGGAEAGWVTSHPLALILQREL